MHNIILDTDPGIDDAQAIAFALCHSDINLLGLTSVFGNASIDVTTKNALLVLERYGFSHVPVARGASEPLRQARMPAPDFVHGLDGMGELNLKPINATELDESAAEFIVRMVNEQPHEISLVAIGPLTNIAQAVILDPSLPEKVKELVVMGGTIDTPGNVTPLAEANFINDPHAADVVCAHDWPLSIIGLDVTLKVALSDQNLAQLRDDAGTIGRFIWDSSRYYIDFYASTSEYGGKRQCAMHDASALVYLVEREAFELLSGPARVVADGIAVGALVLDRFDRTSAKLFAHWHDRPRISAAIDVDSERVRDCFLSTILQSTRSQSGDTHG